MGAIPNRPTSTPHRRAGGGLIAAGLVGAAAIVIMVADRQLEVAAPLLEADGRPRLAVSTGPALSVDGLFRIAVSDTPNLPTWGTVARRQTYRYTGSRATLPATGDAADGGIVVDVMAPADGRSTRSGVGWVSAADALAALAAPFVPRVTQHGTFHAAWPLLGYARNMRPSKARAHGPR